MELFQVPLSVPNNGDIVVCRILVVLRQKPQTKTPHTWESREIPSQSLPFMLGFWRMSQWSRPVEKFFLDITVLFFRLKWSTFFWYGCFCVVFIWGGTHPGYTIVRDGKRCAFIALCSINICGLWYYFPKSLMILIVYFIIELSHKTDVYFYIS